MSRMSRPIALASGFLFVLAACAERPEAVASGAVDSMPAAAEQPAELVAAEDQLASHWNGEDAEAVAAHYATDAVVVWGDSTYEGRDAIRDRWIAPTLPVLSDLRLSERTNAGSGDTRTQSGRYSFLLSLPDSAAVTRTGKFEATWFRQGDAWLVIRESIQDDPAPAN